ncbi:MAG: hypothetical protein GY719_36335 [bacterium]|nr:hypothetical protein [bacterium]
MGLIQDVGGKLVQSFLSLDDLVLGQGLLSEGMSQLGLSGRSVAGTLVVSSNVAARTLHAGVQVGAKTAKMTAEALEGFVPGAGLARSLAERVDRQAAAAAEEASQLATRAVAMTGGEMPRSPLNKEEWMAKGAPRGYSWGEISADTAIGPFGRLATMPLTVGIDAVMTMATTDAGRMMIDSTFKSAGMLLGMLPGASSPDQLDAGELRESLMAVTGSSGDSAARNVIGLAEAAARLALGDTRKLRESLTEAIESMRLLADHQDLADLMPAVPISGMLRQRARNVVDHAPKKLLAALERGPGGEAPSAGAVLSAMLDDADNLRVFVTDYPLALGLMAANLSMVMTAGMADVGEIEAYVRDEENATRPWSVTQIEAFFGSAPHSPVFETPVRAAQDAAFVYSSETLDREKALARAQDLFGKKARERLENDVSLDLDILHAKDEDECNDKLRAHIAAAGEGTLARQLDSCAEQLASLEAFTGSLFEYQPKNIAERKRTLRTFLSLANQHMALRGTEDPAQSDRQQAYEALLSA